VSKTPEVRARRAYFDTRFGQLHVRTAFPGTGGFDEHTTIVCIHALRPSAGAPTSRLFAPLLGLIAADRSVYAPDRPGCGESDGSAEGECAVAHAQAITDLAADLRLRKIDLLGLEDGCEVAVELALSQPELVRRVVLVTGAPAGRAAQVKQPTLVLRLGPQGSPAEFPADVMLSNPAAIAKATGPFLNQR
jgi:pimeloyl-ACP methyl ester carboxylesterase